MVFDIQGKALDQWLKGLEQQKDKPNPNFILRAARGPLLPPRFWRHHR
jgi:hypothetical protein